MKSEAWKSALVIGIILIFFSFSSGRIVNRTLSSDDGLYTGVLIISNGDVLVKVTNWTMSNFSLYLLDFDSGLMLVENESLTNLVPIVSLENINSFIGVLDLPRDDSYLLVITNSTPSPIRVTIEVFTVVPSQRIIIPGILLSIISLYLGHKQLFAAASLIKRRFV